MTLIYIIYVGRLERVKRVLDLISIVKNINQKYKVANSWKRLS